jgi:hypothetical protein
VRFYTAFTDGAEQISQPVGAMKTILLHTLRCLLLAVSLAGPVHSTTTSDDAPTEDESLVQLALLLDTSSSMEGLIEQAKTQLWKLVNEFNGAKQGKKSLAVQIALYEYGNNGLSAGSNYVRQVLPLTRDLDRVSDELFKLTTNGGEEYCGAVIRVALDQLQWDKNPLTYKAIFIAGNEPFTQGPVKADQSCKMAIQHGIVVNTIHCGDEATGANSGWRQGAAVAEGKHLNIDMDRAVVHVDAPQDKEINELSARLNDTYVPFGAKGQAGKAGQAMQDMNGNLKAAAGSHVQRAVSKASPVYSNSAWDLVDANKRSKVKIEDIKKEDLPPEMQNLKPEERQAFVDQKHEERVKMQQRIQELNVQRKQFLMENSKDVAKSDTLDTAVAEALRDQAKCRAGIKFP